MLHSLCSTHTVRKAKGKSVCMFNSTVIRKCINLEHSSNDYSPRHQIVLKGNQHTTGGYYVQGFDSCTLVVTVFYQAADSAFLHNVDKDLPG